MKIGPSAHLDNARRNIREFLNTPVHTLTGTVREVTANGAQAQTALDLLDGNLTVTGVKITLDRADEPHDTADGTKS